MKVVHVRCYLNVTVNTDINYNMIKNNKIKTFSKQIKHIDLYITYILLLRHVLFIQQVCLSSISMDTYTEIYPPHVRRCNITRELNDRV